MPQTNVLFIAVDDLRPQLGCYGDENAITPHIDHLAQQGMVFKRAYCQQAVCNPSRSSLMTGRYPDSIQIWDNATHFRDTTPDVVTLPQHFKNHGYHSECIGKIYHDPRAHRDEQSWSVEEKLAFTREVRGKYVLEENLKLYQPDGKPGLETPAAAECADVPDNAYIDGRVAECAIERLQDIATQNQPFFLAVGIRRPHLPFSAPKKYWDMQHPERVARIANPLPPKDVPQIALHDSSELRLYSDIPDLGEVTKEQSAYLRHGYYAATSYADAQIGKVIAELDRLNLRQNTAICLYSDHGWHLGEHSLWGKRTNFEIATRAPLIISAPNQKTAGQTSRSLVEFIDIYPTLTELCNLPVPSELEGRSLAPILENADTQIRDVAQSQFPRPAHSRKFNRMGYSIRTDRFRYTEWRDDKTNEAEEKELYDHDNDPLETINLAAKPEHKENVQHLSNKLREKVG